MSTSLTYVARISPSLLGFLARFKLAQGSRKFIAWRELPWLLRDFSKIPSRPPSPCLLLSSPRYEQTLFTTIYMHKKVCHKYGWRLSQTTLHLYTPWTTYTYVRLVLVQEDICVVVLQQKLVAFPTQSVPAMISLSLSLTHSSSLPANSRMFFSLMGFGLLNCQHFSSPAALASADALLPQRALAEATTHLFTQKPRAFGCMYHFTANRGKKRLS